MEFAHAVVLTGGIATGKSSVCSLLRLYGFQIVDADKIAHQVLDTQSAKIADLFGGEYLTDGRVERKKLGSLIFSDKEARKRLEALLHPLIREEIIRQSSFCEQKGVPYIVDIPLFFETKHYEIEKAALVYATHKQQLERLIKREGLSEEEARRRIEAQMPIDRKRELATYIIDNTRNLKHLQKEVDRFVEYLKEGYHDLKI
ncbi:MAG: dephospho-CoA kinase [Campylobacteraceae bacterium 4484_4]|nr:MAG: dephospho-CoA kinase [Campylobacteraceae bacterium 4484_4]